MSIYMPVFCVDRETTTMEMGAERVFTFQELRVDLPGVTAVPTPVSHTSH